jgi:glyoxylase-like metal-dependent hydrolase (beta-lactamase superfamily II)
MPPLTRRALAAGLALAPLAPWAASPAPALARSVPQAREPLPSIARLRLGRTVVTMLSDGHLDAPLEAFVGLAPAEIAARLAARGAAKGDAVRLGFTAWLVDDGERLALVDAGSGTAFVPTAGRLPAALAAAGVRPEDIDLVAVTHMHVDHVGGLLRDGRPLFPEATLVVAAAEVAHFTDPAKAAAAPEHLRSSFATAAAVVAAYRRIERPDRPLALTPAIAMVDLAGHTPGHTGYRIADGGRSLLIVGDALFDPALHPARTDVGIVFEADPAAAAAMRRRLFPQAAAERALLAATHMPFPGLGQIVQDGAGLAWRPADWPYGD